MACSIHFRRVLIGAVMLCLATMAKAQQDPLFLQYWMVETQYNPAAVGKQDQLNITAALQTHAMGFDDAGTTLFAGADAAFQIGKSRHGVGGLFQADNIGIFSHKKFSVQYAYQLKMGKGKAHRLSIGASADMLAESADGSKADTEEGNDPAFGSSQMDGSRIDASVGLLYQFKNFNMGLSMLHATAPEVELGEKNIYDVKRLYNVNAAYVIKTRNPYFTVMPSAAFRTDLNEWRADVTARFAFERDKKNFNFGADYAPLHSFAIFIGCVFHGINICYSYEANTEGMGIGAGQHEVTLGYKLDLNLGKKGRNLHKTVRWL
ncbi:MAG: PorP/SprF family type IX secretion system membrane protein [Bacteroidaceae bacterium]|nr:PorP/SprF family type IX secretion system membrane protein [Bacteroidaceae bacterium]